MTSTPQSSPKPKRPPFVCIDCKLENPAWFWVKESVWKEAGFRDYNGGIICIKCFSKRLNRSLTPNDFDNDGPCSNDALLFMYDLGKWQYPEEYIKEEMTNSILHPSFGKL